jgi:tetratricopeptide (TPR) repeat protein
MGNSAQSPSGSASFVSGFPASNVDAVMPEPEYYFTSGEIVANASRPNKDGYALAYSNATFPGMSGGPVLNEQGEMIGIHGRGERAERLQNSQVRNDIAVLKTEFNYAIPINTFLSLAPQINKNLALRIPSPSVLSAPKADDFFLQADEKYERRDYNGAIADYDQAIRLDPKYALAYNGRGAARRELGDNEGAITDYDQAIRLNPKDAVAYANREFVRKLGNNKKAIADYDQAIRLNPKDAVAYVGRGAARNELGDWDGAISDLTQAIRLDPKNALAYYYRGNVRSELGDKVGAITDLDQAIRLNPNDPIHYLASLYDYRGQVRSNSGDKKRAIVDYGEAIRLKPKDAWPYYNRGIVRSDLGDKVGAITDLQKAAALLKNKGSQKNYQVALKRLQQIINGR